MEKKRTYICIDLKSFYASAECVMRKRNPLTTNLVVADASRTDKTICLAVSPSLKSYGITGRPRLFEVKEAIRKINAERRKKNHYRPFAARSDDNPTLLEHPELELDLIIATPQMQKYIDVSAKIYSIYLRYIAKEDIHVYSIDEVFMDVTDYLKSYRMSAHTLAMTMIQAVLKETGITATAGIGENLYLAKVGMDIVAKHIPADKDGVRIAELDKLSYRKLLWEHTPLTDFWRVGKGIEARLNQLGLYTMGDIALCSLGKTDSPYNENLLFREFGVNAELLIDHAWGIEPTTIAEIKKYKPQSNSLSQGQVLSSPYPKKDARILVTEMADSLSMELFSKHKLSSGLSLMLSYDGKGSAGKEKDHPWVRDYFGRKVPKPDSGSISLSGYTSATKEIVDRTLLLFDRICSPVFGVRRITLAALDVKDEETVKKASYSEQISLFDAPEKAKEEEEKKDMEKKEKNVQKALLAIKEKYGKNAVLKAVDYEKKANIRERNKQIGGHKA